MKRVLVLGAGGMAGHVISAHIKASGHEVIAAARRPLPSFVSARREYIDAERPDDLEAVLEKVVPDVVVNCVGVLVGESAREPLRAISLNAVLPHRLALAGARLGFRLIHISTDCVFSGRRGSYAEGDFRDGDDVYARSKALGELDNGRDLTIRTSIVGPEIKPDGVGLFHWFMTQRGPVRGFAHHFWSGVTTLELARAVERMMSDPVFGLVHLTNGVRISKYDMLVAFNELFRGGSVPVERFSSPETIDKSIVSTRSDFPQDVPGYREMFAGMRDLMRSHADTYRPIYGEY